MVFECIKAKYAVIDKVYRLKYINVHFTKNEVFHQVFV